MVSGARRKARDVGMFWGPSVWAGLRPGDAGDAEEELLVQQNTSAVYPTGRVAGILVGKGVLWVRDCCG